MSLDDLPEDVVEFELLSKMNFSQLAATARTSKRYAPLVKRQLEKYISNKGLQKEGWGPRRMFDVALQNPHLRKYFIKDFLDRLHRKEDILKFYLGRPDLLTDFVKNNLSYNRNVFPEDMERYPNIFALTSFTNNRNVTPAYVINHPNIPWTYMGLGSNSNFTISDILNLAPSNSPMLSNYLSLNFNLTREDVLNNPNIDWKDYPISNRNFYIEEYPIFARYADANGESDPLKYKMNFWSWNPNFREEDLEFHVNRFRELYNNEDEDDNVEEILNEEQYFNWNAISKNTNISPQFIKEHPDYPWYVDEFLSRPDLTPNEAFELFGIHEDPSNIQYIQYNPNLTLQDIEKYHDVDYNTLPMDNNFSRDPMYRRMIYNFIHDLLPEKVTISINEQKISEPKELIYGILAAIYHFKLAYKLKYIDDMEEIELLPEDYRMFTNSNLTSEHKLIILNGFPFFFRNDDFLLGIKTVINSNNIPFNMIQYYDRKNNYQVIPIQ